mmetsp:Transcript_54707/g.107027  ORF Transcript_54707/g.107027 Transcript_54707/m.107027 type:complete len:92 (-) Transcript_54707:354-629(-)
MREESHQLNKANYSSSDILLNPFDRPGRNSALIEERKRKGKTLCKGLRGVSWAFHSFSLVGEKNTLKETEKKHKGRHAHRRKERLVERDLL